MRCVLCAVCCVLCGVRCALCAVYCVLRALWWVWWAVYCVVLHANTGTTLLLLTILLFLSPLLH